jgi:hypothetical protein
MSNQPINVGTVANDGTGDTIRAAMVKQNANNGDLYGHVGGADKPIHAANFVRQSPGASGASAQPIFSTSSQTALTSIYWPWVIRVDDKLTNPLGIYYMYYSTDHDPGPGGLAMAHSNSPLGPWTEYGLVYKDPYNGGVVSPYGQTETPSVIWDEETALFTMYYQQGAASFGVNSATLATGQQSTLQCTSTDGINWTKNPNFILDKQYGSQVPGDGHTGYFQPFRVDGGLAGYHLYGGTDQAHFALTTMQSPSQGCTDPRELGFYTNFCPPKASGDTVVRYISWNAAFPFMSRGRLMLFAMCTNFVSGLGNKDAYMAVFPLSKDLRKPLGRGRIVWTPTLSWETLNIRGLSPFIDYDGTLYVYYCIAATGGNPRPGTTVNGVAGAPSYFGVMSHAC